MHMLGDECAVADPGDYVLRPHSEAQSSYYILHKKLHINQIKRPINLL